MAEQLSPGDERLRTVLSYPFFRQEHYLKALADMDKLGIRVIEVSGRQELGSLKILGKGCVGLVVLGMKGGERVAVKVLRSDANRADLRGEGANLKMANAVGVGPTFLGEGDISLVMQYIQGEFLAKWLQGGRFKEEVGYVLRSLLSQCRSLDKAGLDHGELSDAKRHVIVNERGVPFIIDFETASTKRACRNLTAMVNFLFFKESIAILTGRFLCWDRAALRDTLKEYKANPTDESYCRLKEGLGFGD